MKTKILSLLLLVIISSCSSSAKKEEVQAKNEGPKDSVDELVATIENKDFAPPAKVPYVESADLYPKGLSDADSLIRETIYRLPQGELEAVVQEDDKITQASAFCHLKKFNEAFKLLDSMYAGYKNHPSYWTQIGNCYLGMGNTRKATLYYNKALDINPKYAPPMNNIAVIVWRRGEHQKALATFKHAASLNSFSLTPVFNMAQIYLQYGFLDDAYKILVSLRQHSNRDNDINFGLANYFLLKGDPEKAISFFGLVETAKLARPDISINYAIALKLKGFDNDAKTIFSRIDRKQLGNLENHYRRVADYIMR